MRKTARSTSVAVSFGSLAPNVIFPSGRRIDPAAIASPSTRSAFAKSEPRIENWATTTSPAESAKRTMNSSGRFPSVDWSAPVTAGPNLAPTDSVAMPMIQATPPSAAPVTTKVTTGSAPAKWSAPPTIATAATTAAPAYVRVTPASRIPSARTSPRASAWTPPAPCRPRPRADGGARARPSAARGTGRAPA